MRAPAPMLELERIETYRGPAQILRSISLTVGAGEAVCLCSSWSGSRPIAAPRRSSARSR